MSKKNNPKSSQNNPKSSQNNPKIIPNNPKIIPTKTSAKCDEFKCDYCSKIFNTRNSLYKHRNELRCQAMPEEESIKIKLFKNNKIIKKKIKNDDIVAKTSLKSTDYCLESGLLAKNNKNNKYKNNNNNKRGNNFVNETATINNTINNNTTLNATTNNTLTININPFGQENTDFLTKEDKIKIINSCYMSVPTLIQKIHNHPENRNIFMPNMNKNIIAYLNENKELEYNDYNTFCDNLIQNNISRIDKYFCEFENEIKKNIKNRMLDVLQMSNKGELDEKYINSIKYYIMNISKKNKREINEFIEKLELQIKNN